MPGGLGEAFDMPDPVGQASPEDVIIAALDDDEPEFGLRLRGEFSPLGPGFLRTVDRIDDYVVSESELLGGKGTHDKVGSVMRRS